MVIVWCMVLLIFSLVIVCLVGTLVGTFGQYYWLALLVGTLVGAMGCWLVLLVGTIGCWSVQVLEVQLLDCKVDPNLAGHLLACCNWAIHDLQSPPKITLISFFFTTSFGGGVRDAGPNNYLYNSLVFRLF